MLEVQIEQECHGVRFESFFPMYSERVNEPDRVLAGLVRNLHVMAGEGVLRNLQP